MLFGIDNLKLNQRLDYNSDSLDGPLIQAMTPSPGIVPGRPNYVIIYGEGYFNSKRQARRAVELYGKYRSSIHFVAIDPDLAMSADQQALVKQYYKRSKRVTARRSAIRNCGHPIPSRMKFSLIGDNRLGC